MEPVLPLGRSVFYVCAAALAVCLLLAWWSPLAYIGALVFGGLFGLGVYDLCQRRRTLSRNYPILIHFRYFLESIGPELRQYIVQSDLDEEPFSREQRALVYQRAKGVLDKKAFGTTLNVYDTRYEWLNYSLVPARVEDCDYRVTIGKGCARPYNASVFNISAMSFGSLSANAILALNAGAARGGFYHDTGEGSISCYHTEHGGDLVWEIGSGYFGCRNDDGSFSEERFAANAALDQVKMIELKLSQGAKPGYGGLLPAAKVTPEIARARGVPMGQDVVSPRSHSAFPTPLELLLFIDRLRALSGGKPVGFKLAVGHPWEWFAIAKAMLESGRRPDFIVVDGAEGGTGAATVEFSNRVGMPLQEALLLVRNTLVGTNLHHHIRIGAAGKITSAFHIARLFSLGADWCNSARGFMFALGCIQAQKCHTDLCPTGVATQNPRRWKQLDVEDKATRVYNFHHHTLKAVSELVSAAGLEHPSALSPEHITRRVSDAKVKSYGALFTFLRPGELLAGMPEAEPFKQFWPQARADSFAPVTT